MHQRDSELPRTHCLSCRCTAISGWYPGATLSEKGLRNVHFRAACRIPSPSGVDCAEFQQFIELFTGCLKYPSITVKVAELQAITSFLCSVDDESAVLKYQEMMDWILDVVIDVLRSDEDQGKYSLESLIELTQSHGEIWSQVIAKLIYVVSQII